MIERTAASAETRRYATIAIVLHWVIAILIVTNIALGVIGRDAHPPVKLEILGYHKSIGLTVLVLSVLRLAWRFLNRSPSLPATMPCWERVLAHCVHVSLYVIMIGLPLSGWIAVSSSLAQPPIRYFGLVTWPFFPFLRGLAANGLAGIRLGFTLTHSVLGKLMLGLLVLHMAGALKHMIARDGIVWRMVPIRIFRPRRPDRGNSDTVLR